MPWRIRNQHPQLCCMTHITQDDVFAALIITVYIYTYYLTTCISLLWFKKFFVTFFFFWFLTFVISFQNIYKFILIKSALAKNKNLLNIIFTNLLKIETNYVTASTKILRIPVIKIHCFQLPSINIFSVSLVNLWTNCVSIITLIIFY